MLFRVMSEISLLQKSFEALQARRGALAQSSAQERMARLRKLKEAIETRRVELAQALQTDLGKHPRESELTEIHPVLEELNHAIRRLQRWMRPVRVGTPLTLVGTRSEIRFEARGVVLILAPWNYPFYLSINPLIAAIAAGNAVMLKPSEKTPATERFLASLIQGLFPSDEVALLSGGPELAEALLTLPWDHIFFTGSTRVGRLVMEAASKHLSSITLELGGKSPAWVSAKADLKKAARRIAWGKWLNAGQTCVAPDYVVVDAKVEAPFLDALKIEITTLFGAAPLSHEGYPKLVDEGAFSRQKALLESALQAGAKRILGGEFDAARRSMAPTVLSQVPMDHPLMREEIFGPILPVHAFANHQEAMLLLGGLDQPLASYFFSEDSNEVETWLRETRAGGSVINHAVLHLANPELPFGGIGPSGFGAYHGVHGFRTFSHARAILRQGWFETLAFYMPPYEGRLKDWAYRMLRWLE
jgi:aldehyde dehydrogenase (NAD+)